LQNSNIFFGR
jgi:hypothetical protein